MGVERSAFERWICAHELTHVFQFQGVPWLREHMSSLVRKYLESVEVRIDRGAAGGLPSLPNPRRLVETFREGGLAALIQTREQRSVMARLQAAMAVIEGHSEHVMDSLGERLIPDLATLRAAMARRRGTRSAPERVVERLLGLDLKLAQYELGKAFCDAVVRARRHRGPERGVARARRPAGRARAARSGRLARARRAARRGLAPPASALRRDLGSGVTSAPRRFTNVCSMV